MASSSTDFPDETAVTAAAPAESAPAAKTPLPPNLNLLTALGPETAETSSDTLRREASALFQRARAIEPTITKMVSGLAGEKSMVAMGLEFRLKSEGSIIRKLRSVNGNLASITDALRYTLLANTSVYNECVREVVRRLVEDHGLEIVVLSNYWESGHSYKGINAVFKHNSNVLVEVQFHTFKSYDAKQFQLHEWYETWRTSTDPTEKYLAFYIMVLIVDEVPTPNGILSLGTIKRKDYSPDPSVDKAAVEAEARHKLAVAKDARAAFVDYITFVGELAAAYEKVVSVDVKAACDHAHGVFLDYDERIKNTETIGGKFHHIAKSNRLPAADVLKSLEAEGWSLRYFMSFDTHHYTVNVKDALVTLNQKGYKTIAIQNYWDDIEYHDGIKVVYEVPPDLSVGAVPTFTTIAHPFRFQVKFVTYESFQGRRMRDAMSRDLAHSIGAPTPSSTAEAPQDMLRYSSMKEVWDQVPVPEGARSIGDLQYGYSKEETNRMRGVKLNIRTFTALDSAGREAFLRDLASELSLEEKIAFMTMIITR